MIRKNKVIIFSIKISYNKIYLKNKLLYTVIQVKNLGGSSGKCDFFSVAIYFKTLKLYAIHCYYLDVCNENVGHCCKYCICLQNIHNIVYCFRSACKCNTYNNVLHFK